MFSRPGHRLSALLIAVSTTQLFGCDKPSELVGEHLRRGDAALAEGRYAQALSAYHHAHEIAPHDAQVQRATMRARVYLMAEQPARVGLDALDDVAYEAAWLLEAEPSRAAVCQTALANVLLHRGDIEGAKAKLAEAIKTDAHSVAAHTALGNLYLNESGALETAKIEFDLALREKPDALGPLVGLGRIKLAEGDLPGAIDKLEAALRHNDDVDARLALGTARLRQGKHAEAAKELRRVLLTDARRADASSGLGQALLGLGQLEEAESMLRAAMQVREDQATAVALGFTLVRLNKPDQALPIFHKVLATNGNVVPAWYGSALAQEKLGRTNEALDNYRRVLAAAPDGPQKDVIVELQKEAKARVEALTPAPTGSASASPAPTGASRAKPPPSRKLDDVF
jgi:tetratricopeptide (TPR) repeat protein